MGTNLTSCGINQPEIKFSVITNQEEGIVMHVWLTRGLFFFLFVSSGIGYVKGTKEAANGNGTPKETFLATGKASDNGGVLISSLFKHGFHF